MEILFITQKLDKNDDILGVYHRWVEELAKKLERISVICLYRGVVELPANVEVYSLGKETGRSRFKYIKNFYTYLWRLRGRYGAVFVHMNPEYVLLGWCWWKITGKKVILWYNHPFGTLRARLAVYLANQVLFTSPFSFASKFKKSRPMPVGVDTDFMRPGSSILRHERSILFVGRLSPIKNIETLIEAVKILNQDNIDFSLTIVGDPTPGKTVEEDYARRLKTMVRELGLEKRVVFHPAVPYREIAEVYNRHAIFVNLTSSGSFDKTILEAMACELLILASNRSLAELLPPSFQECYLFREGNSAHLVEKLECLLKLSAEKQAALGRQLRELVITNHSLKKLTRELVTTFKTLK